MAETDRFSPSEFARSNFAESVARNPLRCQDFAHATATTRSGRRDHGAVDTARRQQFFRGSSCLIDRIDTVYPG
ncbi:hypothetical protein ACIA5E_04595 [Nocardia asteroides]|uniref:hypothetical protein n=1 Tax=Nocardia asteroides TaxID=1824 RepID=UPI0037ACDE86